jgi:hypothetical protein
MINPNLLDTIFINIFCIKGITVNAYPSDNTITIPKPNHDNADDKIL